MNRKYFIILIVIYSILMIIVHLLRGGTLPIGNIFGIDKLLHISEYIIYAFLFINAIKNPSKKNIVLIIIFGTIFGALIEFMQQYVADRYASFYDGVANTIGLIIGSIISYKYLIISNDKEPVH